MKQMADGPGVGTGYLRIVGDFSQINAQAVGLFSSSRFAKYGKVAGAGLAAGLAAGGALKGLYEIGQAFDDASDKLRTTTGKSGKELAKLERSFKNVVSGVPADFDSASTAVADLNQRLGLTGKPLQRLSKQMLELSRITETDVGTNVQSITRLFGDWSIKTGKQTKTLDQLFRASQATGIGVSDLSDLMVQFGSPLRQLGLDFETSAAMFARFEKEGVNIQTLMPGLRMALKNFSAPTDDLTASFDKLGISLKDGPSAALQEVFEALENAPSDLKANALAFEVFGARAGPDMAAAVREGRFELDELMRTIKKGDETIRKAGRETMDFGEQWQKLKNNVFVALEPVAKKVFGALGDEMERVTDILTDKSLSKEEKFTAVMDEIQRVAKEWGPEIAEAGGKIGVALLKGIANAFLDSSILGKLFIGAAALRLFGGPGVFGKLGVAMGRRMAGTMATTVAAETAAGGAVGSVFAGSRWTKLGKIAGRTMGVGMAAVAAHWFANNFQDDISGAAADIFGGTPGENSNLLESLTGVDLGGPVRKALGLEDAGDEIQSNSRRIQASLDRVQDGFAAVGNVSKKTGEDITRWSTDLGDTARLSDRFKDKVGRDFVQIGNGASRAGDSILDYSRASNRHFNDASEASERHKDHLDRDGDKIGSGLKTLGGVMTKYSGGADKNFGKVTSESAQMARGVGRSIINLADAVYEGFGNIGDNTDEMLGKLKAKKLGFAIKKAGRAAGSLIGAQQGAAIVPGTGSGDTVPLHIGGQLAAMVEPREQVSVLNRTATAAVMAINKRIPRLAKGGGLDFALGPYDIPPIQYAADHAGGNSHVHVTGTTTPWVVGLGKQLQKMGFMVGEHPAFGGVQATHSATGGHYDALAIDINSAANETRSEVASIARLLGGSFSGAVVEKIKRVLLKGRDGPLRDLGQAGLDRAWKAANAYLSKQAPSGVGPMGGGSTSNAANRALGHKMMLAYPFGASQWPYLDHLWGVDEGTWDENLANLAGSGAYGIAQALPSSKYPAAGQPSAPPGIAKAKAQIGWGLNYIGERYGDPSSADAFRHSAGWYQKGGIVHLAKGGKPDKSTPRGADDVWEQVRRGSRFGDPIRGSNALKAALKAQKKLGRLGRAIAIQDELIDRTDRLASLESGPAGSELSLGERDSLIGLNTTLLRKLAATGALSAQGLALTERGMKNASGSTLSRLKGLQGAFKESQVEALGLTGRSGRLFDTKLNLKALRNTPLGSAATAEARAGLLGEQLAALTAQLRVSQSQYGAFGDYFPKAHGGGILPGPVGQERPFIGLGGEQVLTRDQQRGMSPHIETNVYVDPFSLDTTVETIVDGKLRKVAKQTARRVPTGRI